MLDDRSVHPRLAANPADHVETVLAEVLADLVGAEPVSVDSHFFDDLCADSMVMAHFCARVRKRADMPSVSMRDVYRHPTIRTLVADLAPQAATGPATTLLPATEPVPSERVVPRRATTWQYLLCGTLQLLLFLGASYLAALIAVTGYGWISAADGLLEIYLRSAAFAAVSFLGLCAFPVLAKWTLIGRWKPGRIDVWSLAYVRFWLVKSLVRSSPVTWVMVGSPLYPLYLRALGARVGPGVLILSRNLPVCTDLLTIGADTVIGKDSLFTGYSAHAGVIRTGAVTLGSDVVVGEATVIDIDTSMGDASQLGHSSSLQAGQAVPVGERWHGSPAQRTEVDYRAAGRARCGARRRALYVVVQVLVAVGVSVPLAVGGVTALLVEVPRLASLLGPGPVQLTGWTFYRDALLTSLALFVGSVLAGLLYLLLVPAAVNLALEPNRVYRLYGFHYRVHRMIARTTNIRFFAYLFGDSSAVVHYLRVLEYELAPVVQTGSNFGLEVKHENAYLSSVGSGTQVADGLSIMNTDYSSTSFCLSRVTIGNNNFVGNNVAYPARGRTGDNCLLATKVMVPLDGEIREGVGLLGSPSFEIPRSVQRDGRFDHLKTGEEFRRRLTAKNRHNAVTIGLYLLVRWIHLFGVMVLAGAAADLYDPVGAPVIALALVLALLFSVVYFVLVECVITRFGSLRPQFCSIYEPYFWWHERLWKVPSMATLLQLFNGTPFKNAIWGMLGVRIGRRLFDDGATIPERTLVTLGDDVTLNANSTIQCHSQEDDTFKSDAVAIGSGATLGVGAFVLYGVTMGDGATLAPDSFLMKGENVPPGARWWGNPARETLGATANGRHRS